MNKTKTESWQSFKSGKIELPDKSFAEIGGKQIRGKDGCWIQIQVSRVETLTFCFARIYMRLIRAENCVTELPKSLEEPLFFFFNYFSF